MMAGSMASAMLNHSDDGFNSFGWFEFFFPLNSCCNARAIGQCRTLINFNYQTAHSVDDLPGLRSAVARTAWLVPRCLNEMVREGEN